MDTWRDLTRAWIPDACGLLRVHMQPPKHTAVPPPSKKALMNQLDAPARPQQTESDTLGEDGAGEPTVAAVGAIRIAGLRRRRFKSPFALQTAAGEARASHADAQAGLRVGIAGAIPPLLGAKCPSLMNESAVGALAGIDGKHIENKVTTAAGVVPLGALLRHGTSASASPPLELQGPHDGFCPPDGFGSQGGFGPPDGFGPQVGFGCPDGFGSQGGFGRPDGFGPQGGFGRPDGFG
jgi:hypothetical protein